MSFFVAVALVAIGVVSVYREIHPLKVRVRRVRRSVDGLGLDRFAEDVARIGEATIKIERLRASLAPQAVRKLFLTTFFASLTSSNPSKNKP